MVRRYILTAASQHWRSTCSKLPSRTAARSSLPVIGTIRVSSRLPRSISFVTVEVNPFQEIKKPRLDRRFLFSNFSRNMTNSSLLHFPVQFLHSTRSKADSRRRRGSALSFKMDMSISSVAVRMRLLTVNPLTDSNNLLHSSSKLRPLSSVVAAWLTAWESESKVSEPQPERRAATVAICFPISSEMCSDASSSSEQICHTLSYARPKFFLPVWTAKLR